MTMTLGSKLILRLSLGLILVAALLFIPAGSLRFWQAWAFLALAFIPISLAFFYLYKHDPGLLARRLQTKEKVGEQKLLIRLLTPFFLVVFLLPGLDYRFGWSRIHFHMVPLWLMLMAQALFLGGYFIVVWVLKVNSFAAHTIQVEPGQPVISTGPYRLVRHPMYSGSILMWVSTPLVLGSFSALPLFALLVPFYVLRLLNEEKVLRQELPGYSEYCLRTRFRLVPFVW